MSVKNSYPFLPEVRYQRTSVVWTKFVEYAKTLRYSKDYVAMGLAIIAQETSYGAKGINHNYGGIQADVGKWSGISVEPNSTIVLVDSGGKKRRFLGWSESGGYKASLDLAVLKAQQRNMTTPEDYYARWVGTVPNLQMLKNFGYVLNKARVAIGLPAVLYKHQTNYGTSTPINNLKPQNPAPVKEEIKQLNQVEFEFDQSTATRQWSYVKPWPSPDDALSSASAAGIASSAVESFYPPSQAEIIKGMYSSSLSPSLSSPTSINIPFLIVRSFDFFQKKISAIPGVVPPASAREKKKILEEIRNNPLFPVKKIKRPLTPQSEIKIEEIKAEAERLGIVDARIEEIQDKAELIDYINENGYAVYEEIDPLAEVESLIDQEIAYEEEKAALPDEADLFDACAVGDLKTSGFSVKEIDEVASKACKIEEIADVPFEEPEIEIPDLPSIEDVENLIAEIQQISDQMTTCSQEKSEAEMMIQKFFKIREDLFPLYFFVKERYEYLNLLDKKEASSTWRITPADLLKILTGLSFNIGSLVDRNILVASDSKNFPGYSNQSGSKADKKMDFFFLVNEDDAVYKEVEMLYKMHEQKDYVDNFLYQVKNAPKKLEKISQNPSGFFYRDFYNAFNSVDRVDSLFTYQEQGYLTPKIPNDQLSTQEGQEKLKDVKIDEAAAEEFLRNYGALEKARVTEKIEALKKTKFFQDLKEVAQRESSMVYQVLSSTFTSGIAYVSMKKHKTQIVKEYEIVSGFYGEISKKIDSLTKTSEEKQKCIDEQVKKLEERYPSQEAPSLPAPGNDPFGANPIDPRMPGPTKNYYWREFTKKLQTVSLMPIPDLLNLRKRLFRYYPVGIQIPVPAPPGVLPTLASGIPDKNISIPFPIVWKHLVTLTLPVGQLVLWITYCAPFTFSPYLMYIDEKLNFTFLISPKGKVEVPAKSLKWDENSPIAKSLMEKIPGIKVPLKDMPPLDSTQDPSKPDNSKSSMEELRNRIKLAIDKLDSDATALSRERSRDRSKLAEYRDAINQSLDMETGGIDLKVVKDFLGELKKQVFKKALKSLDFEPFEIPKTQKKRSGELSTVTEIKNAISKVKALKSPGSLIETGSIDVEKILTSKSLSILDSPFGKKVAADLDRELAKLNTELRKVQEYNAKVIAKERSKTVAKKTKLIIQEAVKKIDAKVLGFVPGPVNLTPVNLPEPAFSDIKIEVTPPVIMAVMEALKRLVNTIEIPDVEEAFYQQLSSSLNVSGRLPSGRDLLAQSIKTMSDTILRLGQVPVPGWPNNIVYPKSATMLKQAVKDAKNAIWKIKFRLEPGGIPPIKITPDVVKKIAEPVIGASVDTVFAVILEGFDKIVLEQSDPASIKLQNALQIFKAIFGSEIWDVNEQDVKTASIAIVKQVLQEIDLSLEKVMKVADVADKSFDSILKKFAPFSKQDTKIQDTPTMDLGAPIAKALMGSVTAGLVSGKIPSPPFPVVLLGCSLGTTGWKALTNIDPFRAIEKLPPYERISMKNVPYLIFLDMMATTAQRYGGLASNYVPPYFTPDS
jgi:hypothetical protein